MRNLTCKGERTSCETKEEIMSDYVERMEKVHYELIDQKLHEGIRALKGKFNFDLASVKVNKCQGIVNIIDNPDYSALVARVHGGWEARTYAYLKLVTNDGKLVSAKS